MSLDNVTLRAATLDDLIERLTARIEATGTDITAGYDH